MAGALLAGLAGEIELGYAFVLGAGLAFAAALICVFLRFPKGELPQESARVSPVVSPADP